MNNKDIIIGVILVKVSARCGFCLINRAISEIKKTISDEDEQFELLRKIFNYFSNNFDENSVPSFIGTIRDRIIREHTNKDPYEIEKRKSNEIALGLVSKIEEIMKNIDGPWERFRKAIQFSIVGNIIEFDIIENSQPLENLKNALESSEKDLEIDDSRAFFNLVKKSKKIVFLADNAGEIVFDKIFIKELTKYCDLITVIVKEIPVLNDATMEDAEFINLTTSFSNVKVITSKTDHVGIIIEETPKEVIKIINDSDLIIAKGMGYYETLTEYKLKVPVVHLLRTKCKNVSDILNVGVQKNIVLIRN
jgi:hypothetical protein